MKIYGKLLFVIFSIAISFLLIIAFLLYFNFFVLWQVNKIKTESLNLIIDWKTIQTAQLNVVYQKGDIKVLEDNWLTAIDNFEKAFEVFQKNNLKRMLGEAISEEVINQQKIWGFTKKLFMQGKDLLNSVINSGAMENFRTTNLLDFYVSAQNAQVSNVPPEIIFNIYKYISDLNPLITASEAFEKKLIEINNQIEKKIKNLITSMIIVSIIFSSTIMAFAFIFVSKFSRRLQSRIKNVEKTMSKLADKDFTVRIIDKGKDEIFQLGKHLNNVLEIVSNFLGAVKESLQKISYLKENLATSTAQSVSSINEINSNLDSISKKIKFLDENINQSYDSITNITNNIMHLSQLIDQQSISVEGTLTSIKKISDSLNNVSALSSEKENVSKNLIDIIFESGGKIKSTNSLIKSAQNDITQILEITTMINSIAEQTNILSMNAAIESAHAGEAGKGFGVVAEEVGKLAESTSDNARQIDGYLKSIVDKINNATSTSTMSLTYFEGMKSEVEDFTNAMIEISKNVNQLTMDTNNILGLISNLSDITKEISEGSSNVKKESSVISNSMDSIKSVSSEINLGVNEIETGAKEILKAVVEVNNLSNANKDQMEKVEDSLNSFKTSK